MSELLSLVKVGIADMKIAKAPIKLKTSGLGSCVGVILYDEYKQLGGMAHVMLPDSGYTNGKAINRFKYADTAIEDMLELLLKEGASRYRLKAKAAGGAQMFQFKSDNDMIRIGPRNIEAVKRKLKELNIPLAADDVGGKDGRTIVFDLETALLTVRKVNQKEVTI